MESPPPNPPKCSCYCEEKLRDLAERVDALNNELCRTQEEVRQLRGNRQDFGGMVVPVVTSAEVPRDTSEVTMDASEHLLLGSPLDLGQ